MMFAILSIACVLYTDGQEHCDVRSKKAYEAPNRELCVASVREGTFKVASSALTYPGVEHISAQESYCYDNAAELSDKEQLLPGFMEALDRTYVLTRY